MPKGWWALGKAVSACAKGLVGTGDVTLPTQEGS